MDGLGIYSRVSPVSFRDVGKCYYCGCESEFDDYAPPQRYTEYYVKTAECCSLAIIPCCKECHIFLQHCREGLIEERKIYVNGKIERKYKRALNIYERWNEDELEDLDLSLVISIKAGIALGGEAYQRLRYLGFEYEIDGTIFHTRRRNMKIFTVFGEEFDNFRNALQYAARSYKININTLRQWLMEHNTVFDDAINAYFEFQKQELLRKKKKKLCAEFAKEHKQNSNFIKGALDAYMEANPSLGIEQCLELIYEERVKR